MHVHLPAPSEGPFLVGMSGLSELHSKGIRDTLMKSDELCELLANITYF